MNRAPVGEDGSDSDWDTASVSSASEKASSGGQRPAYEWAFQHFPSHVPHLATREAAQPYGLSSTVVPGPAHAAVAHATHAREFHHGQGLDQQDSGAVRIAPTAHHAPTAAVSQNEMIGSSRSRTLNMPGQLSGRDSRRIGESQLPLPHRGSRIGVVVEAERVLGDKCRAATQSHSMRSAEPVAADARQCSPHHLQRAPELDLSGFSPSVNPPMNAYASNRVQAGLGERRMPASPRDISLIPATILRSENPRRLPTHPTLHQPVYWDHRTTNVARRKWNTTTGPATMHTHEQSIEMLHLESRELHLMVTTMRYDASRSSYATASGLTKSQASPPYGGAKHATTTSKDLVETGSQGRGPQFSRTTAPSHDHHDAASPPYGGAKHATTSSKGLVETGSQGRGPQLSRNASSGASACPGSLNYDLSINTPDVGSSPKKVLGEHATDRLAAGDPPRSHVPTGPPRHNPTRLISSSEVMRFAALDDFADVIRKLYLPPDVPKWQQLVRAAVLVVGTIEEWSPMRTPAAARPQLKDPTMATCQSWVDNWLELQPPTRFKCPKGSVTHPNALIRPVCTQPRDWALLWMHPRDIIFGLILDFKLCSPRAAANPDGCMEAAMWAAWLDDVLWVFYQLLEHIRVYGKEGMLSVVKLHTGTQLRQKLALSADTSSSSTVQVPASGPSDALVRPQKKRMLDVEDDKENKRARPLMPRRSALGRDNVSDSSTGNQQHSDNVAATGEEAPSSSRVDSQAGS
ncbi:hypothetical protein C8Q76DRAFT_688613 [Earliella scabrosa]|nr:hypothetical protein C8Q76DRAFT_688613 [Earliella scabrosa]